MKCLFFFVQYFPVLLQTFAFLLSAKIVHHTHSDRSILFVGTELSPQFHFTFRDCEVWAIYQAAAALVLLAAVDYIILLRGMAFDTIKPR
jgi:hypothetical protein